MDRCNLLFILAVGGALASCKPSHKDLSNTLADLCAATPGCTGQEPRRYPAALGLRGIADGWNVVPPGLNAEPGWFVDETGTRFTTTACSNLVATKSVTPPWSAAADPLTTSDQRMAAVRRGAADGGWSPFGTMGSVFRVAKTEISHSLDVNANGVSVETNSDSTSISAQLWRRMTEVELDAPNGKEDLLRSCCAAYGCGSGILVRSTSRWDRMYFKMTDVEVDVSGSYLLQVDVEGNFELNDTDFEEEAHIAVKLDAGFGKATTPRQICVPPAGATVIDKRSPDDWSIRIDCLPGFKLQARPGFSVAGTGPTTVVKIKNPGAPTQLQVTQLSVVADSTGPFKEKGPPQNLKPLDIRYAVIDSKAGPSLASLVQAARYTPSLGAGAVQECEASNASVSYKLKVPPAELRISVSSAWVGDGGKIRAIEPAYDAQTQTITLGCGQLGPTKREVCGEESGRVVDVALITKVASANVGLPLATVPARVRVRLRPALYCDPPSHVGLPG